MAKPPYDIVRNFEHNGVALGDLVYVAPAICQKTAAQSHIQPESSQYLNGDMQGVIIDPATNRILYELIYNQTRNKFFLGPGTTIDGLDRQGRERYEYSHELTLQGAVYLAAHPDDPYTVGDLIKLRAATDTTASNILEARITLGDLPSAIIPHPVLVDDLMEYQLGKRKQDPGTRFLSAKPPNPNTEEGRA